MTPRLQKRQTLPTPRISRQLGNVWYKLLIIKSNYIVRHWQSMLASYAENRVVWQSMQRVPTPWNHAEGVTHAGHSGTNAFYSSLSLVPVSCTYASGLNGERGRNRTCNLLIKSQLLCQLSYAPFNDLRGLRACFFTNLSLTAGIAPLAAAATSTRRIASVTSSVLTML